MTRMADHKAQIDHTCLQVGLTAGVIKTGTYSLMSKEHSPLRKQFLNTVKTYFRGWTLCPPVPKCQRKLKIFPRGWSNHMKNEFSHATRYAAHKKQNLAKIIKNFKKNHNPHSHRRHRRQSAIITSATHKANVGTAPRHPFSGGAGFTRRRASGGGSTRGGGETARSPWEGEGEGERRLDTTRSTTTATRPGGGGGSCTPKAQQ